MGGGEDSSLIWSRGVFFRSGVVVKGSCDKVGYELYFISDRVFFCIWLGVVCLI